MSTFISYSRADSSFAVRLAKDLKLAGFDVWLDQLDIQTGDRWDDKVEAALESCKIFMIVLSPESLQSQNVKDEIGFAIDAGKGILPVKIKSGEIPFRLRRFQYVDFSRQSYAESLKEIKSLLSDTSELTAPAPATQERPTVPARTLAARTPLPAGPAAVPPPRSAIPWKLVVGALGVIALVAAGIIGAARANRSPAVVPPSEVPVSNPAANQSPTPLPTTRATQAPASGPAQPEGLLTTFADEQELADWEQFVTGEGRKSKVNVSPADDGLVILLDDPDLHAYFVYTPVVYEDVALRIRVENLGQNTHMVSLVCRRTGDSWYEFRITGGGEWQLIDYQSQYFYVVNGGTQAINYGRSINEYEMVCLGNEIAFRVNGQHVINYRVRGDVYTEGQVGFSISSNATVFPIEMKVLEFEASGASTDPAAPVTPDP